MTRPSRRALCLLAVTALTAATAVTARSPAARADTQITFPVQAMEGNLQVSAGSTLQAGYGFTMPGNHPAAAVEFTSASVTFDAACVTGPGGGVITVPLAAGPWTDPANDGGDWFPDSDQSSPASDQGAVSVPALCGSGAMSLAAGGSFTATLASSDPKDPVSIRWHYSAGGSAGGWSATQAFTPGPGGPPPPPPPPPPPQPTQIIVKVDLPAGYTISDITAAFPVKVDKGGLATFGIYLVSPTGTGGSGPPGGKPPPPPKQLQQLAGQISHAKGVIYAQVNLPVQLADTEFYAWPYGPPVRDGKLPSSYTGQPAVTTLQLAAAHAQAQGAGVTVAVLDTGASNVPALHGKLLTGWNYVADNGNTHDAPTRAGDAAVGHGTFVSGLIALTAPAAKILPEKVLNSNGYGTVYGAAQAITQAVTDGASVINLSFGTTTQPSSPLLQQAIAQAQAAGVVVVAAAGNEGSSQPEYPASWPQALSVAALSPGDTTLTSFSDYGPWVDVGAPGEDVVGPMPGGGYDLWAGTSMSAPFVAGQAALIRSLAPAMHANQVFQAIQNTAAKLPGTQVHNGAINIPASLTFATAHP